MRNPFEASSSNGVFFIDLYEPKNYMAFCPLSFLDVFQVRADSSLALEIND